MWKKPQEIAGWKALGGQGNGFEITWGSKGSEVSLDGAIKSWKGSKGHNNVMAGKGIWATLTKIGCYFENRDGSGWANCWFSD